MKTAKLAALKLAALLMLAAFPLLVAACYLAAWCFGKVSLMDVAATCAALVWATGTQKPL